MGTNEGSYGVGLNPGNLVKVGPDGKIPRQLLPDFPTDLLLLSAGVNKGDKGDPGSTGAAGPQGITGMTGATGPQGHSGAGVTDGAVITRSTAQAIASLAYTPISFDTIVTDNGGLYSGANPTRLTAQVEGFYIISGECWFQTNATGRRVADLIVNGVTRIARNEEATTPLELHTISISTTYYLAIGDYVELFVYQTSTVSLNIISGAPLTIIPSLSLVGAGSSSGGDVYGPASSVDNRVAFFDGTTGKLIKDSGLTLSGVNTGDQVVPVVSDVAYDPISWNGNLDAASKNSIRDLIETGSFGGGGGPLANLEGGSATTIYSMLGCDGGSATSVFGVGLPIDGGAA